jgi:hypothetical protein
MNFKYIHDIINVLVNKLVAKYFVTRFTKNFFLTKINNLHSLKQPKLLYIQPH